MKKALYLSAILALLLPNISYANKIVDTGQSKCYDNHRQISCPSEGRSFYGQDAQYIGNKASYKDNGDGTVSDFNTGLMWSKAVNSQKVSLEEAEAMAEKVNLGGYSDWRVPNIKELYSLIDFNGYTGMATNQDMSKIPSNSVPFIDSNYFDFAYGQVDKGERFIDGQWLSSTRYVSKTMNGDDTLFGVNFVDGRIKGYGYKNEKRSQMIGRTEKKFYVRFVRGDEYGINDFQDNNNGTVTDKSTSLVWQKSDSEKAMDWEEALEYCEDLSLANYSDWRLPNAKELQYIVDYSRSPDTTDSPAISPIFNTTSITNEDNENDFPYFWSSTTHLDGPNPGGNAAYVAFGRALGKIRGRIMDVHGAGAQRSDPKNGRDMFRGPQGDAVRSDNYVRCVRGRN